MRALIYACDLNRGIGFNGQLPWPSVIPDMARFKSLTRDSTIIMGKKTFQSLKGPLPYRRNVVVSTTLGSVEGVTVCDSIESALTFSTGDVFFIGGTQIYLESAKHCDAIYETVINSTFRCDTFLSESVLEGFKMMSALKAYDHATTLTMTFNEYRRAS